ncbi:unnamed protein product [Caenorhabditis angaria]|uniref:RNA-directed RNA polymerase n=1 Tax=Caenorhabditis angaria TaxID=860376 RepID=A0A9P1MYH4_9PELO|nr:unnamed protein product [Caenorhabditis angaria]
MNDAIASSSEDAVPSISSRNQRSRRRGFSSSLSTFSHGRSNFSSGTLPNRKDEVMPVNTLSTGHSSKILVRSYRLDRSRKTQKSILMPIGRIHNLSETACGSENENSQDIVSSCSTTNHADVEEGDITSNEHIGSQVESSSPPGESPFPSVHSSYVDRFTYPTNRMYWNDSIFQFKQQQQHHQHQQKIYGSTAKRFSLPSTHILYERNRHRDCSNIAEQEKVTEMLRAKAAENKLVAEDEAEIEEYTIDRNIIDKELKIRITGPLDNETFGYLNSDIDYMKDFFANLLKESSVDQLTWEKTGNVPRATYEEQAYSIEANITLREDLGFVDLQDMFINFLEESSKRLQCMLHDQPFFEIPKFSNIFPRIFPQHSDVPLSTIAIGNCPNQGVFLVRGDYIANENAICSLNLYPPNSTDVSRESHAFKVSGTNQSLSFAKFEHDKRQLMLYFGIRLPDVPQDGLEYAGYRLNLYYNSFVRIVVDLSQEKTNSFYIQLKHPPQLWEAIPKSSVYHPSKARVLNMETCTDWVRVLSWPGDADKRGIGCSEEAFAQSCWIRIVFRKDSESGFNVSHQFMEIASRLSARSSAKLQFGSIFSIRRKLTPTPPICSLGSFRADYSLQALITRGSVVTDQLFDWASTQFPSVKGEPIELEKEPMFLKIVRRSMKECSRACEETLEQLLNSIDERRVIDLLDAFYTLFKSRRDQYERLLSGERIQDIGLSKPLPKNCVAVPKVIVCPTRVLLMAPEVMMINRVVRKFGPDYALRCVFRDDNGGRLVLRDFSLGNIDHISNIFSETIYNTLKYGIFIADRVYSFLGWSNSQMRDQGCYLYAPKIDPNTGKMSGTVEEIREWMGDFREAISVPKMMSRMGQCFTQAQPTVKLMKKHWIVEYDIEGGYNNKYCFSDGCGRISFKLAQKITKMLNLKEVPACFQVRFKGFKGIVVIDPMIDEIIDMPKIIFRKSQRKFLDGSGGMTPDYLEVVKYAMPSPVCLNRPFITILDQVSEKQSALLHQKIVARVHYYLERELSLLSNMLVNEKCAAEELMNRSNLPIDWIHASASCGFQLTTDPFIRNMIVSIYRYNIIHHISKAKIFLPGNMGRSMYGVVDETGLLQHGQVFIQYSPSLRQTSKKPILLSGKVLITKNPCHVPGDVRVFDAVYQPSLAHLVDVVVFPQHGPRPHPDEMAGSDLDGDEYSVIWDQEMLLNYNEKAMIFPSSSAIEEDKEPTTDDMVEFFLKYLQQDSIGRMSNAHLAFADYNGLFHEHCHSIALKCSVAVDFPKSGVPAEPLASYEQCDVTPDYMMSGGKPMYYSTRLNGQLYRKARKVEEILEEYERRGSIFEGDYDKILCPDDIDVFHGNEKSLWAAVSIRDDYSRRIQQLLDEYGIEDEASIVSGHAAIIKRLAGMEKDDYSFYHTDKVVELRYEKLFATFRYKFFEEFGGEDEHTVTENRKRYVRCTTAMHEKIRQWYYVSYVMPRKNKSGSKVGQSLPWVVWEVLCDLRRKLILDKDQPIISIKYPIANRFVEEIQNSIVQKPNEFEKFKIRVQTDKKAYAIKR